MEIQPKREVHINCYGRSGAVVKGVEHISDTFVNQDLSGVCSSPVGSISRDLNSQKFYY